MSGGYNRAGEQAASAWMTICFAATDMTWCTVQNDSGPGSITELTHFRKNQLFVLTAHTGTLLIYQKAQKKAKQLINGRVRQNTTSLLVN